MLPVRFTILFQFAVCVALMRMLCFDVEDVYVFMLYWTFILYAPLFVFTGICASLVLILDPLRRSPSQHQQPEDAQYRSKHIPKDLEATQRRCIAYGIAVLVLYGTAGLLLSVLSSTVVGFLIAGVYAVGRFRVST